MHNIHNIYYIFDVVINTAVGKLACLSLFQYFCYKTEKKTYLILQNTHEIYYIFAAVINTAVGKLVCLSLFQYFCYTTDTNFLSYTTPMTYTIFLQ